MVSPISHKPLFLNKQENQKEIIKGDLKSNDEAELYNIVEGIPLLQPMGCIAEYNVEILEVLFGEEFNHVRNMLYNKYGKTEKYVEGVKQYIKKELDVEGVYRIFEEYSQLPEYKRLEWWYKCSQDKLDPDILTVTKKSMESGRRYASKDYAQNRVCCVKNFLKKN